MHKEFKVKHLGEQLLDIVTAYQTGKPDSLVVVIPKRIRDKGVFKKGQRFLVKIDEKNRLIYEPLE
jgi:hypothetical protein